MISDYDSYPESLCISGESLLRKKEVTKKASKGLNDAKHMRDLAAHFLLMAEEKENIKSKNLVDAKAKETLAYQKFQNELYLFEKAKAGAREEAQREAEAREEKKAEKPKIECSICQNEYNGIYISWLPCIHGFCENCIKKNEEYTNGLSKKCPLCIRKYKVHERTQGESFPW